MGNVNMFQEVSLGELDKFEDFIPISMREGNLPSKIDNQLLKNVYLFIFSPLANYRDSVKDCIELSSGYYIEYVKMVMGYTGIATNFSQVIEDSLEVSYYSKPEPTVTSPVKEDFNTYYQVTGTLSPKMNLGTGGLFKNNYTSTLFPENESKFCLTNNAESFKSVNENIVIGGMDYELNY